MVNIPFQPARRVPTMIEGRLVHVRYSPDETGEAIERAALRTRGAIGDILNINERIRQADEEVQFANARSSLSIDINKHLAAEANNIDFREMPARSEQFIQDTREHFLETYGGNERVWERLEPEMEHAFAMAGIKIDDRIRKLWIADFRGQADMGLANHQQSIALGGDFLLSLNAHKELLDSMLAHGVLTETEHAARVSRDKNALTGTYLDAVTKIDASRAYEAFQLLKGNLTADEVIRRGAILQKVVALQEGTDIGHEIFMENPNRPLLEIINEIMERNLPAEAEQQAIRLVEGLARIQENDENEKKEDRRRQTLSKLLGKRLDRGYNVIDDLPAEDWGTLIVTDPEFAMGLMDGIPRDEKATTREQQAENEVKLMENLDALRNADLPYLFITGEISKEGYTFLRKIKEERDPLKTEQAKLAFDVLSMLKDQNIFDPEDEIGNILRHAEYVGIMQEYIVNHPEKDPVVFVKEMIELPAKRGWMERMFRGTLPFMPGGAALLSPFLPPVLTEEEEKAQRLKELRDRARPAPVAPGGTLFSPSEGVLIPADRERWWWPSFEERRAVFEGRMAAFEGTRQAPVEDTPALAEDILAPVRDISVSNITDPGDVNQVISGIVAQSRQAGIDPFLGVAVAWAESNLNPNAKSRKGAIGVMQLMPKTAQGLGINPEDINQNIQGGTTYLAQQLKIFEGDEVAALAAYNWGPTALRKHVRKHPNDWQKRLPAQTRAYIRRVEAVKALLAGGHLPSDENIAHVVKQLKAKGFP